MPATLSTRQRECLRLSANLYDEQIAERLGISVHTVRSHITEAKIRLSASDRKSARLRLLTQEGGHSEAMAAPEPAGLDSGVTTDDAARRTDWSAPPGPLLGFYFGLGRWRTPPRQGGGRILLILIGAIALVLVVSMVSSVLTMLGGLSRWR